MRVHAMHFAAFLVLVLLARFLDDTGLTHIAKPSSRAVRTQLLRGAQQRCILPPSGLRPRL
eukprot:SAG11_NODE_29334_length_312_cov_0.502347_1_plen_61_part_10